MSKIAVIQIRGTVNTHPDVRRTLDLLRLRKKHACVVVEDNAISQGMLQKVKDYTTFGPISEEFFAKMIEERGEIVGGGKVKGSKIDVKKIAKDYFASKVKLRDFEEKFTLKPYFRLHPPKGGFERGGIKQPVGKGGTLGKRDSEKITKLITKML